MAASLALVTMVVYWPVGHYDFVNYDDPGMVIDNPMVRGGLTLPGLCWALTTSWFEYWHPLTWLSHMLDCELFGLRPGGHHLMSLGLHVANTLLLFAVLRRMTGALWRSAMVAALFALHPLHVESVAWLAERKDVLSGFFFMLTLWAYVRYAEVQISGTEVQSPKANPPSPGCGAASVQSQEAGSSITHPVSRFPLHASRFYVLALVFFACGLMSKPMLMTLPFVLLLLDYWPLHRFQLKTQN
jgi:hypothetical protein